MFGKYFNRTQMNLINRILHFQQKRPHLLFKIYILPTYPHHQNIVKFITIWAVQDIFHRMWNGNYVLDDVWLDCGASILYIINSLETTFNIIYLQHMWVSMFDEFRLCIFLMPLLSQSTFMIVSVSVPHTKDWFVSPIFNEQQLVWTLLRRILAPWNRYMAISK